MQTQVFAGLVLALAAPAGVLAQNIAPATTTPAPAAAAAGNANSFNPAISLILSGGYTRTTRDPADTTIKGFALSPEAEVGPGSQGFSLAESELGLSANIDPWWRGNINIALHPDDAVSVEEGYVENNRLGYGLALKLGRFFSNIGYLNSQHAHVWDFADAPLAYQAMLGTQYGDDGVQLRWLAPTDRYLELSLELGRGRSFPGSDTNRNGSGMSAFSLHLGDDVGESHSWRAGLSLLQAKASAADWAWQDAAGQAQTGQFTGTSKVMVLDGVWKWAPQGNATQTNFKLQGEYLRSRRSGTLDVANPANADEVVSDAYSAKQAGWYVQGIYQFMPSWRVGLRTERLAPGQAQAGANEAALAWQGSAPRKNSVMLDFSPSEFSRLRLQVAQDQARDGKADRQIVLQYQMSLGAHGAHSY